MKGEVRGDEERAWKIEWKKEKENEDRFLRTGMRRKRMTMRDWKGRMERGGGGK